MPEDLGKYLGDSRDLYLEIKNKIDACGKTSLSMFVVDSVKFSRATKELVNILCNDHELPGIYLTTNKPYESLLQSFSDHGINTERLLFIDCISQTVKPEVALKGRHYFINSPSDLTQLEIAIQKAVSKMPPGDIFIMLDSISTLLIYNKKEVVERFIHLLATKIRAKPNTRGIFIAIDSHEEESFIDNISQFCDYAIKID